jgi:hypothetical protein
MQKNGVGLEEHNAKFEFGFGGIIAKPNFNAARCAVNQTWMAAFR